MAEEWDYGIMPALPVRYDALVAYAEARFTTMDAGARAAMCAAAVRVTPAFSMTAYTQWGASAERRRFDEAARRRARDSAQTVATVVLARELGAPRTPLARALSKLPSGLLALVGDAAARI
jgi:hypothetical protein